MLTAAPVPFMGRLPPPDELDSTEPLDSVMEAVAQIVKQRTVNFTDEVKRSIHLATGTRTEYCEALLKFICHH
jgi:hypothetical protein